MEKEETYYERVDPLEQVIANLPPEEFFEMSEIAPIFANEARTVKATITDGDYTLQEGIDYETFYYRGHGKTEIVWFAVAIGKGKYDKMFFHAGECRLPSNIRASMFDHGTPYQND